LVSLSPLVLSLTIDAVVSGKLHDTIAAELPVVESAALGPNLDVPWSQPVKVTDPFEGNYLAVFDRHYFYRRPSKPNTRTTVISLWSSQAVRFLLSDRSRDCYSRQGFYHRLANRSFRSLLPRHDLYGSSFGWDCVASHNVREVIGVSIKLGEQVFRLKGQNSGFAVSNELAKALQSSPIGNVDIRLTTRTGEAIDSEIGQETVKAWKAIY